MKAVQGKDGAQMFQLTELKDEFMARTSEAFGSVDLRQKLSASLSPFQRRERRVTTAPVFLSRKSKLVRFFFSFFWPELCL